MSTEVQRGKSDMRVKEIMQSFQSVWRLNNEVEVTGLDYFV